MEQGIKALTEFLDASPSVYHAVDNLSQMLKNAGYTCLSEADDWNLEPGGNYYLIRGGSALIAFRIPRTAPQGFLMSASHADRPCFKVKENGELAGTYTRLATEKYGGIIDIPFPLVDPSGDGAYIRALAEKYLKEIKVKFCLKKPNENLEKII